MILYAKHLVLMSLALLAVPAAARVFARFAGRANRVVRPGVGLLFLLSRVGLALLVPVVAQALYAGLWGSWPDEARYLALGLTGAAYGATFGDWEDYPPVAGAFWGALGGLGTALLYALLPPSGEARALCVALFAALPLLAYEPFSARARRRLSSHGMIVPSRRMLR